MVFEVPFAKIQFEIPADWWGFADMGLFSDRGGGFYPYSPDARGVQVVPASEVKPPLRDNGVPSFKKYKLVPVLFAFQSPECALPPIEVCEAQEGAYRFRVLNGYHRYYASIAVGYEKLPVLVRAPQEL